MLTVYACQMDITWENKPANFARVHRLLEAAQPAPGGLIVLPEMFATGFSMNANVIAEKTQTGETTGFLSELAQRFGCHVIAGVVTWDGPGGSPRNEALLFDPNGRLTGFYTKQRPFTPSGEKNHYAAGDQPVVWTIGGLRIAPLICYDLRFPELFRETLSFGVDAFVVIASWPVNRAHHWSLLLQARAIENQAYVVGVNRVGDDPAPLKYPGRSLVVAPDGMVLNEADDRETVLTATLDQAFVAAYRCELPFLADR